MIFYLVMIVVVSICGSAFVAVSEEYTDIDDYAMIVAAALFWPLTLPIFIGTSIGIYLKRKK